MTSFRSPEYQTGSSQYALATSEAVSANSADLQRMTLGPAGWSMLISPGTAYAPPSSDRMHTVFNAAMEQFLKEQQTSRRQPMMHTHADLRGMRDVEMRSVGSHSGCQDEFHPADLSIDIPRPALVASAGISSGNQSRTAIAAPRIRVSAISELKEFSGKENDEDRARSWLGTAESFHAKQLEGSAGNVPDVYYHARKRSDESPLEYLHRLNIAGLRARLQIKDGPEATRREHVEHLIKTLDDRDLADQLALLHLADVDALEDTLRAHQRAKARQGKAHAGSNRFRQKATTTPQAAPPKTARAIQADRTTSDSSESESDTGGSGSEDELRQIYVAAFAGRDSQESSRSPHRNDRSPKLARCSHCGSFKHDELGCWTRLTCEKCNRKGHPSEHCLFVCHACGEIHEAGKCPMEEFYNLIRQWYVPTKHAGMLPVDAEKMLI
ncbi:hypothetical protein PHPALM_28410 [Phytophthora palmivora]|uniref:CCHC-type domain-containing protein n=1 Tax=Phytophthora palmivora TaxID=4796 RepID=A0A2P4XA87_9STRA|nr:hypothetical protein PHPALM_28410 [Phytophthora palmivora]